LYLDIYTVRGEILRNEVEYHVLNSVMSCAKPTELNTAQTETSLKILSHRVAGDQIYIRSGIGLPVSMPKLGPRRIREGTLSLLALLTISTRALRSVITREAVHGTLEPAPSTEEVVTAEQARIGFFGLPYEIRRLIYISIFDDYEERRPGNFSYDTFERLCPHRQVDVYFYAQVKDLDSWGRYGLGRGRRLHTFVERDGIIVYRYPEIETVQRVASVCLQMYRDIEALLYSRWHFRFSQLPDVQTANAFTKVCSKNGPGLLKKLQIPVQIDLAEDEDKWERSKEASEVLRKGLIGLNELCLVMEFRKSAEIGNGEGAVERNLEKITSLVQIWSGVPRVNIEYAKRSSRLY
jgi:hypothetical protein